VRRKWIGYVRATKSEFETVIRVVGDQSLVGSAM
jgi:hypothetical protein